MFKEVLAEGERRSFGAYFMCKKNILRLIELLFLNELREEFRSIRKNEKKLEVFRRKLHGCGFSTWLAVVGM